MPNRNIKKLIEQAKKMPTSDLCYSELNELYSCINPNSNRLIFDCFYVAWLSGYASGYNRAKAEAKKHNK